MPEKQLPAHLPSPTLRVIFKRLNLLPDSILSLWSLFTTCHKEQFLSPCALGQSGIAPAESSWKHRL